MVIFSSKNSATCSTYSNKLFRMQFKNYNTSIETGQNRYFLLAKQLGIIKAYKLYLIKFITLSDVIATALVLYAY